MILEVRDQLSFDRGVLQGRAEGLAQGKEVGRAEGFEQGRQNGLAEGEERLSRLIAALIEDGRDNEVARAVSEPTHRDELYRLYNIG